MTINKKDIIIAENIMKEILLSRYENLINELDVDEENINIDVNNINKKFKSKFSYPKIKKRNDNESIENLKFELSLKMPDQKILKMYNIYYIN